MAGIIRVNNRFTVNGSSAYGPTAEITRMQQQGVNMEIAIGANPWLAQDLPSLMRIAQSGADPLSIADNAAALAGMESLDTMAQTLSTLNPVAQRAAYAQLTEQQQRGLQQMGFQPQKEDKGWLDGTPLEGAWDLAADVAGVVTKPVSTIASPVVGGALDLLTWVGDVPAHFYRAIRQMEGWQQWLAAGAAIAAIGAAAAFSGGAALALLPGTLGTLGMAGTIGLGAGIASTIPTAVTNPSEWWDMMNPFGANGVGKGERIFQTGAKERARNILGGAEHLDALARDIAVELDVYELAEDFAGVRDASSQQVMTASLERVAKKLAEPGTPEFQAVFAGLSTLLEQPEFRRAVDELQQGKISFGRDIAGGVGLDPGDFGYGLISGSADAFWLLTMDPTMFMGKMGSVQKLWRRGIEAPSGAGAIQKLNRMVNEDPAIGALADQVSKAINDEIFTNMPKAWRSLYQPMVEYKRALLAQGQLDEAFDVKSFMQYIEHGDGLKRIMEGKGTVRGIESIVISHHNKSTNWGRFVESVRDIQRGLTDVVLEDDLYRTAKRYGVEADLEKMLPSGYADDAVDMRFEYRALDGPPINETWGYQSGRAVGNGLLYVPGGRSLGNFIGGITTMIPAGSALKLTPGSADDVRDFAEDIPRFVEAMGRHMNMPSGMRDEWLNTIMRQENVAMRRNALVSFMDSLFTATGFRASDEWSSVADEFLLKYKQAYALGGADVATTFGDRIIGVLPDAHSAVYMVMPDLREMSKIVRQGHILKNVARVVDHNFAEQAMSRVIKPGWLMRIGFIPRAAGEEFLAFWLRMSEGGLAQEFAARTVAKRRASQDARRLLIEAEGDMRALTKQQRDALRYRLPTHLKPMAALGRRQGWHTAEESLLDNWVNWTTTARERGLGIQLPEMKQWQKQLLIGKDQSVRSMVLQGVDDTLLEAGREWLHTHSSQVLRATSSMNASLYDKSLVNPETHKMLIDDRKNPGRKKEVDVIFNGDRGRVTPGDQRYAGGVHNRASEWSYDDVVRDEYARTVGEFKPESINLDRHQTADVLEAASGLSTYNAKMLFGEFLQPRQDNFRALAVMLKKSNPELSEVLLEMARRDDISIGALIDGLRERAAELKINPLNGNKATKLLDLADELEPTRDVLVGMETLDASTRAWASQVATRQMTGEHPWDVDKVRAWANGELETTARPKNVYYRGVKDSTTLRLNADGSLTLVPQRQSHWEHGGENVKAVSLSTNPGQSVVYASDRGTTWEAEARAATGAMLEIDADFINSQYGRTLDDLRAQPQTYSNARFQGDGPYLVGPDGTENFTEVALVTQADEVTIPAGRWRVQSSADMDEMIRLSQTGEANLGRWNDDVKGLRSTIQGQPMDVVAPALSRKFDDLISSFTEEEVEYIRYIMAEQYADLHEFNSTVRYDLNRTAREIEDMVPHSLFGKELLDEGTIAGLGDELTDGLARKINEWLYGDVVDGEMSVLEAIRGFREFTGPLDSGVTQFGFEIDDLIRERLGIHAMAGVLYSGAARTGSLDTLANQSRFNALLNEAWDLRGQGAWEGMTDPWSPFIESWEDMRDTLVSRVEAKLHRPEHTDQVKMAEQVLHTKDGSPVARPPADGLKRIYQPVVPPETKWLDDIIDRDPGQLGDGARAAILNIQHNMRSGQIPEDFGGRTIREVYSLGAGMSMEGTQAGRHTWSIEFYNKWNQMDPDLRWAWDSWPADLQQEFLQDLDDLMELVRVGSPHENAARTLLRSSRPWHFHDEVIDALTEDQKVELLTRAIQIYDQSRTKYGVGITQVLNGQAFDDPRIARWISSMFSNSVDDAARVGMLEVPRRALSSSGANIDGVRLKNAFSEATGREWLLDDRYASMATPLDASRFHHVPYKYTTPTGTVEEGFDVVTGKSLEEAYREWAETIVDTQLDNTRRGVREQQVFKGQRSERQIARMTGDRYEPLQDGEAIAVREDLYAVTPEGKVTDPIQTGDSRFFDHVITEREDDIMWNLVGPMIRDVYEENNGLITEVAKDVSQRKGLFGRTKALDLDTQYEADQFVTMTRSRIEDVHAEPSAALPNVAIARDYDYAPDTIWDRIVRYGFDNVIGPAIDSMVRHPMSFHYFAAAYAENKRNLAWMLNRDLFDVEVAREFAPFLDALDLEVAVSPQQLDDLKLIAKEGFGIDLADEADVRKWVASTAQDQHDWREKVLEVRGAYNRKASLEAEAAWTGGEDAQGLFDHVTATAPGMPSYRVVEAVDRVRDVNRDAIAIALPASGIGGRSRPEQLVKAYHDAVPDEIWEAGADAVRGYLAEYVPQLPSGLSAEQWRALNDARNNLKYALTTARETAAFRAMENVIPFLDSHEQRSMLGEYARNMVPFWYAEENFIKRWARTMSLGTFGIPGTKFSIPSAGLDKLRKAQLTYMGIKSAGLIRTDANGQDWVVYPGSNLLIDAVSKFMPGDVQPIGVLFAASTDSLLPGLTPDGNIAPSPFVAMPAHMLAHFFPDATPLKDAILGPIGSQRSIVSQFVPSIMQNTWEALFNDEDSSVRYASAMMAAIAYSEAEGRGLPDGATAAQLEDYLDQMSNHARIIMTAQALAGYVVPGSPRALATGEGGITATLGVDIGDPEEITSETYRSYIKNLGIEEGTAAFLRAFPLADLEDVINPLAFTGSATETVSRAPLPSTELGVRWYQDNASWVDQLPEAGAWFMPQDGKDEFEYTAYRQQLASGLRKRRTPEEFVRAIKYRNAATTYFDHKDAYDEAVLQVGGDQAKKRALETVWQQWSKPFLAANPIFAEELATGDSRTRRDRQVQQMRYAVQDPSAPDSPYKAAITEMVEAYDMYNATAKQLRMRNTADNREKLRAVKDLFASWGEAWVLRNPDLERLWTSVYRLEADVG